LVVTFDREAGVGRREGRTHAAARTDNDIVMERVGIEKRAEVTSRQGGAFGDGEEVREPGNFVCRIHERQFTERKRIRRRAELARIFALLEVDAALHEVPASGFATV